MLSCSAWTAVQLFTTAVVRCLPACRCASSAISCHFSSTRACCRAAASSRLHCCMHRLRSCNCSWNSPCSCLVKFSSMGGCPCGCSPTLVNWSLHCMYWFTSWAMAPLRLGSTRSTMRLARGGCGLSLATACARLWSFCCCTSDMPCCCACASPSILRCSSTIASLMPAATALQWCSPCPWLCCCCGCETMPASAASRSC